MGVAEVNEVGLSSTLSNESQNPSIFRKSDMCLADLKNKKDKIIPNVG